MALKNQTEEHRKYLELLAREFPTQEATVTEIINLQAIINLPKGTEHFMSDLRRHPGKSGHAFFREHE